MMEILEVVLLAFVVLIELYLLHRTKLPTVSPSLVRLSDY